MQVRVRISSKTYQFIEQDTMNKCKRTQRVLLFQILSAEFVPTLSRCTAGFQEAYSCKHTAWE